MFACLYLADAARAPDLVALAQDFSPRFEIVSSCAVLVDVSGLDRLVGDADAVGAALARLARQRGLAQPGLTQPGLTLPGRTLTPALAPTRTAAMLMALADTLAPAAAGGYRLVPPHVVAATLAPLPLTLLASLHELEHGERPSPVTAPSAVPPRRGRGARTRGSGRNYRLAPGPHASRSSAAAARVREADAAMRDLVQTLHRWGLQTLGAFAALPPVDLFERLGTSGLAWQAVARGEDARPLVRTLLEDPFEATTALEWPVETLEPLSFVVSGLLEPLCARLARAERGAAALQTTLQLVNRTLHVRRLELPAPMRDVRALRTLVLLDLESHPPEAGVDRVTLTIAPTPERIVQHSLLARARPSPEQVATLTARLMAVLGETRVGAPALVDSYAPGAFTLKPFDGDVVSALDAPLTPTLSTTSPKASSERGGSEERPFTGFVLRRFRTRVRARVERAQGRPVRVSAASPAVRGGRVVQAAGPWRTSGAWWELGGEPEGESRAPGAGRRAPACTPWDRDEWDVVVTDGTALRVSRDRASGEWFVDGVLD
jgi:protein ImuB